MADRPGKRQAAGRGFRPVVFAMLLLVAACVEERKPAPAAGLSDAAAMPAVSGIYDCGEDGRIQVAISGDAVRVTEADGTAVDLPASPPGQGNRFGEGVSAIVIEGSEALYMRARREPWSCIR
jgi:sarcosine oxidase gamma subunit